MIQKSLNNHKKYYNKIQYFKNKYDHMNNK